jgi:hypothetical protein
MVEPFGNPGQSTDRSPNLNLSVFLNLFEAWETFFFDRKSSTRHKNGWAKLEVL